MGRHSDSSVVIDALIECHGRVLCGLKHERYILPGGKQMPRESDEATVRREMREEFSGTELGDLTLWRTFQGQSITTKRPLTVRVYTTSLAGILGDCSGELEGYAWISVAEHWKHPLSDTTRAIMRVYAQEYERTHASLAVA